MSRLIRMIAYVLLAMQSQPIFAADLDGNLQVDEMVFAPFITEMEINNRISDIADHINKDYKGKNPVFVCVLAGAMPFCSDLMRKVTTSCEVDFLKLVSYHGELKSSGEVIQQYDLTRSIEGRDVIVVEDIVDTGKTIKRVVEHLRTKNPASIRVATLLWKQEKTTEEFDFALHYVGFNISDTFVIGYGLDYQQKWRNLPLIYKKIN